VGIGTVSPVEKLDVHGNLNLDNTNPEILLNDNSDSTVEVSLRVNDEDFEIVEPEDAAAPQSSLGGQVWMKIINGDVGIGTTTPGAKLDVRGDIMLKSDSALLNSSSKNIIEDASGSGDVLYIARNPSGSQYTGGVRIYGGKGVLGLAITANNGRVGIGTTSPAQTLDVSGTTRSKIVQITGGSDVAERFNVNGDIDLIPGLIVSIDPDQPGELRVSDRAYDRTVAGCISGANGINPGLVIEQENSIMSGDYPVALTGRVYCYADAAYGSIEPGDLLTTSDTPGHMMVVKDYDRAHGSIIGKAMTGLKSGRGLILVLVTLQ